MEKDFMNWRMRTSLRLLGMPQRKNKTVTRMNGTRCPAGKRRDDVATTAGCDEEGCSVIGGDAADSSGFGFTWPDTPRANYHVSSGGVELWGRAAVTIRNDGGTGEIRTPDLMLRRHPLYPSELR